MLLNTNLLPLLTRTKPTVGINIICSCLSNSGDACLGQIFGNNSDATFIGVGVRRVVCSTSNEPARLPMGDLTSDDTHSNLVTDPTHLVIPIGNVRNAQLLFVNRHRHRHCFHIQFIPIIPRGRSRFTISIRRHSTCGRALSTKIGILTNCNAVFFIHPGNTHFGARVSRHPNRCTLHGSNGAIIIISSLGSYTIDSRGSYRPIAGARILPNQAFHFRGRTKHRCHFGLMRNTTRGGIRIGK